MARPKKKIDQKQFENLCALQCTEKEICGWFGVCEDTLNNWCKTKYKDENGKPMCFSDVFAQKREKGMISLRRNQVRLSETSASMAIWLGKNWLGQSDKVIANIEIDTKDDALSESLRELAKELEKEGM